MLYEVITKRMLVSFPTVHITKTHPIYRRANVIPKAAPNLLILMVSMVSASFPGPFVTVSVVLVSAQHQDVHSKAENKNPPLPKPNRGKKKMSKRGKTHPIIIHTL